MDVQLGFLVVAAVVSLVWWVPQLVKVLRYGSDGVSVETWTVAAANLLLWGWWAFVAGEFVVAVVEWVQAAGSVAVVVKVGVTRRAMLFAGVVVVVVLVTQVWLVAASVAAVGSVAAVRVPQLVRVVRDRVNGLVSQVSGLTWFMSGLSNVFWLGWGVTGGYVTMVVGAGLSVVLSGVIALVAGRREEN